MDCSKAGEPLAMFVVSHSPGRWAGPGSWAGACPFHREKMEDRRGTSQAPPHSGPAWRSNYWGYPGRCQVRGPGACEGRWTMTAGT